MFVGEKMKGKDTPYLLKPLLLPLKRFFIISELLRNV